MEIKHMKYILVLKQVWTQKCAVQKASVDIINLKKKKKIHGHRVLDFL